MTKISLLPNDSAPTGADILAGVENSNDTTSNFKISDLEKIFSTSTSLTNPYKFLVNNAGQSIPTATWVKIGYNTINFDTSSNFSTANNNFVAPIAGFYFFTMNIHLLNYLANSIFSCGLNVNTFSSNPTNQGNYFYSSETGDIAGTASDLIKLNAGDTVAGYVYCGAGNGTVYANTGNASTMSGFLVSAA